MKPYKPLEIEPEILNYWKKKGIYAKTKVKNKGKKSFYFLDGPPYTSGKVHIGTAWNKSLKDSFLRYKRMTGINVWDRAGYDMHGVPTEQGVQKEKGLKTKDDIIKYGVSKFVKDCKDFSITNMEAMNKDFKRLGVWMGFENAYKSIDSSYMEGEWWLIKKAYENKRLYKGKKTMHWCAKCGTSLAKHELEYKNVTDESIFIKFKVKNKKNEFLIIWTTTPWTIPFNLGIMVNPELDYVKAKVNNETWIVAKQLASVFIKGVADKDFKITEEFKGKELEGTEYEHPFSDAIADYKELKQKSPKVHTVVLSEEYVDTSSGTGLVHMAPGCGPEDYEVGHRNNIPPYNNLTESGVFPESMKEFSGLAAKRDDKSFIEALDKRNALVAKTPVEHDYAFCWRCKQPIIYRTTEQWFFKVEDMKDKMRELNKKINWVPESAGSRNFDSWLDNLRDNGITRQRFWGTPIPLWECSKCKNIIVVGSIKELKKLAGTVPDDLHKPKIDNVKLKCKCGSEMERCPDILDVWIDAGSASWNCLDYPGKKELFEKLFPADFILEGIDQIRGWFNLLFVNSMVAMQRPSYKAVYMHGFINDASGRKMSKSLGNYILPDEVISKYGADTLRYYMIGAASPGVDLSYNFEDMTVKSRNLTILWNLHNYLIDLYKTLKVKPSELEYSKVKKLLGLEEKHILSKLNSTIEEVTDLFDNYALNDVPLKIEEFFLELSRTYLQLVREKASIGSDDDKKIVLYTLYKSLSDCLVLFTPIAPFITEKIYLDLKDTFKLKEDSISLVEWVKPNKNAIDKKLEENMEIVSDITQSILSGREKIQRGIRWPVKEVVIITDNSKTANAVKQLGELVKRQTNVKEIKVQSALEGVKLKVRPDYGKIAPEHKENTPKIIAKLSTDSPETILSHIEEKGKYEFSVDKDKFAIEKKHLIIERELPDKYGESEFKEGFVYLNKQLTDELEAEGFSREICRRIQALRKTSGLEKNDRISLYIKTDDELSEMLGKFEESIKVKVGADKIKISEQPPAKKHKNQSEEKIKDKIIELFFDKI
ncbi:MAG: isoleucine--tRNA ligase [Candidatus Woesearchaeota archaeon]|jgi:isoleucyl-tRNA synthetase|nr:isoleucine--tRNA ligase [Candidatus Woesearchaeota archaeon]MDP7506323.1 isoleucine--tRNA ligase [Candidatus Woesearchaeota archaeon]|tara:strand:- start:5426 stop:8572 length:3147 start_codon:yes stop_codon:yes gene_type:complete